MDGELIWQQCIGGEGNDALAGLDYGVVKKTDKSFVIATQTDYGPSYDVLCTPYGGNGIDRDFWVFEIKDTTTNINTNTAVQRKINVYPNPAKEYVVFEVQSPPAGGAGSEFKVEVNKQIRITNTFGQQVAWLPVKSVKTIWDTRNIQNGIYFYSIEIDGKVFCGKIVVRV